MNRIFLILSVNSSNQFVNSNQLNIITVGSFANYTEDIDRTKDYFINSLSDGFLVMVHFSCFGVVFDEGRSEANILKAF